MALGPAGLILAQLLHQQGIDSVILERKSRDNIEGTVKANIVEQTTIDILREIGVGDRMDREGHFHDGNYFQFNFHKTAHIDLKKYSGGKQVVVYPQHEVIIDLVNARYKNGKDIIFDVEDVTLHDIDTDQPKIQIFRQNGLDEELVCDFIAGCDGFYGPSRLAIPDKKEHLHLYKFGWLGILADAAPAAD